MDPEQLKQDKDFMSASPADQHAYLAAQDKDYASATPQDQQAYLSHVTGRATMSQAQAPINTLPPEQKGAMQSYGAATGYGLSELGKGLWDTAKGFGSMLDPRTQTPQEETAAKYAGPGGVVAYRMGKGLVDLGKQATQVPGAISDLAQSNDPLFHLGMAAPRAAGQGVGQVAAALAPKAIAGGARAVSEATAPPEPNAAISEGLHVPMKSKLMQQTVRDVEASRPYLGGRTAAGELPKQADIQARIPGAKQEIFSPINKALDLIKDNKVKFGGEDTTVGKLQEMRNQLSSQRSKMIKGLSPEQVSELRATGGKVADLYDQIEKIDNTLDPEIAKTGIDPAAIRRQYGAVRGVERRISGKSTVTEPEQAYGVRKLIPFKAPGALGVPEWQWKPIEGIRDIRAGQPWSGKPSDVGIGRVFPEAGAKPNFGTPRIPQITNPARLLPRGPIPMGSAMEPIGQPSPPAAQMLPYQPSLQKPPAFVRPMEIRPAPGTMELLPPEKFPANRGLFDINVEKGPSAPRATNPYERAVRATPKGGGGHAGGGVASAEELSRAGKNYLVKPSGVTYHGKSFAPEATPPGAAHVTVLPSGELRVNAGDLTPDLERLLHTALKAK